MENSSFLKLLQSVDAFFPIGAFTLSNGLEDYVVRDRIRSEKELSEYLEGFLQIFPYNDLGLLALAYKYFTDHEVILYLDQAAAAMKSEKEIRQGSIRMSSRYIKAREAIGDCTPGLCWYNQMVKEKKAAGCHPVALGIYAAELEFPVQQLLIMYGYNVISAIVNNAVKLVPLSQMAGQRILNEYFKKLESAVQIALHITSDQLGISGCAYEIHCMNHEYLYSRQYMS